MSSVPFLPINPADLLLINDLLGPYTETVKKSIRASYARNILLERIDNLSRRITSINTIKDEEPTPFILTTGDIRIMLSALELFLMLFPLMDASNKLKQTTLRSAQQLYSDLKTTFQQTSLNQ